MAFSFKKNATFRFVPPGQDYSIIIDPKSLLPTLSEEEKQVLKEKADKFVVSISVLQPRTHTIMEKIISINRMFPDELVNDSRSYIAYDLSRKTVQEETNSLLDELEKTISSQEDTSKNALEEYLFKIKQYMSTMVAHKIPGNSYAKMLSSIAAHREFLIDDMFKLIKQNDQILPDLVEINEFVFLSEAVAISASTKAEELTHNNPQMAAALIHQIKMTAEIKNSQLETYLQSKIQRFIDNKNFIVNNEDLIYKIDEAFSKISLLSEAQNDTDIVQVDEDTVFVFPDTTELELTAKEETQDVVNNENVIFMEDINDPPVEETSVLNDAEIEENVDEAIVDFDTDDVPTVSLSKIIEASVPEDVSNEASKDVHASELESTVSNDSNENDTFIDLNVYLYSTSGKVEKI